MLPEIQDNCPGKVVGIDSETVVANTLSRCLAYTAERRTSQGCLYYMVQTTVQLAPEFNFVLFCKLSQPQLVCGFVFFFLFFFFLIFSFLQAPSPV